MEDFSNLIIYSSSKNLSLREMNLAFSVFREQGFGGFISDSSSLPEIMSEQKYSENAYCSLGFPYSGIHKDIIMNSLIYLESIQSIGCGGFVLSVDKNDVETSSWDEVRGFVQEASALTDRPIFISIDPTWCTQPEDISRFFSIISSQQQVLPIVDMSGVSQSNIEEKLRYFGKICELSTTKGITLFCPGYKKHAIAVNPKDYGFDKVIISPSMAVAISREY